MKQFTNKLTYANVVATLALFLALTTGGAYAASKLIDGKTIKAGTVHTKQLANRSVTSSKLSKDMLANLSGKGKKGDQGIQGLKGDPGVKGDDGAKGDTGLQGIAGSAKAWGAIDYNGNLTIHSSNVTSVTNPSQGVYCVTVTGLSPSTNVYSGWVDQSLSALEEGGSASRGQVWISSNPQSALPLCAGAFKFRTVVNTICAADTINAYPCFDPSSGIGFEFAIL